MGRDPSVQLLTLITCPFPLLNLIFFTWFLPAPPLALQAGFLAWLVAFVHSLYWVGSWGWGVRWGSWGNSAAFPSGLKQALVDETYQSCEKGFWAPLELRKAYVSSRLCYWSTPLLQGCTLISSHLFVMPRRSLAANPDGREGSSGRGAMSEATGVLSRCSRVAAGDGVCRSLWGAGDAGQGGQHHRSSTQQGLRPWFA